MCLLVVRRFYGTILTEFVHFVPSLFWLSRIVFAFFIIAAFEHVWKNLPCIYWRRATNINQSAGVRQRSWIWPLAQNEHGFHPGLLCAPTCFFLRAYGIWTIKKIFCVPLPSFPDWHAAKENRKNTFSLLSFLPLVLPWCGNTGKWE